MRRKKRQDGDPPATGGSRITPADVQQVEFRLAFRGYNERDVDAFLDRLTEDLASYMEEAERLRNLAAGASVGPVATTSEATVPGAEDILMRAREEASEIVRRAEQEAEAIRGTGGDARVSVKPFLAREREFLQGLGSLVQSHAEEIRQMVIAVRARSEAPAAHDGPSTIDSPAPTGGEDEGGAEPETEPETEPIVVPDGSVVLPDDPPARTAPQQEEAREEPVAVERESERAVRSEAAPSERREPSLRELFWGED